MQLSELYRRGIVVPTTESSRDAILARDVALSDPVLRVKIDDSEEAFYAIWDTGIFSLINASIGTLIDDYEEEVIHDLDDVQTIRDAIEVVRKNPNAASLQPFLDSLDRLCQEAIARRMPLVFVL